MEEDLFTRLTRETELLSKYLEFYFLPSRLLRYNLHFSHLLFCSRRPPSKQLCAFDASL